MGRQAIIQLKCDGPECDAAEELPAALGARDPLYRQNPPAGWRELVRPDQADSALTSPTPLVLFHEEACANRWWAEHMRQVWAGASPVEDIPF